MDLATNRSLRFTARLLQIIVAVVFFIAAALKSFDLAAFAQQIASYDILPRLAVLAAWCFIIAETVLAMALVLNLWPRAATLLSIVLLLGFIGVTVYGVVSGNTSNCGCFGSLVHRSPPQVILEDALMILGLIFASLVLSRERTRGAGWKLPLALAGGGLMVASVLFSHALPVDSLATDLRAGMRFTSFPLESGSADVLRDTRVIFLFSLRSPGIEAESAMMNTLAQDESFPAAFGMLVDGPASLTTAKFQYGLGFEVAAIEPRFARGLYRTLPRTFILHNGVVADVWNGIPTARDLQHSLSKHGLRGSRPQQ